MIVATVKNTADAISVYMDQWTAQHQVCMYILKRFKDKESAIEKQGIFRKNFRISHHGKISVGKL